MNAATQGGRDTLPVPMIIGGERQRGARSEPSINPSNTAEVVGLAEQGDASHVRSAIRAARDAQHRWADETSQVRHDVLLRAGLEILSRRDELGTLLAREEGKLLKEAVGEVIRAGHIFQFFAGECLRNAGELLSSVRPGICVEISHEPIGVVGIITPWNFPIAIPAWKIAPALAFGNAVVFKPAELVPTMAWQLVDILHRAGLPAGVLNLVIGPGAIVGNAMLEAPEIDAISFTGSQGTGTRVAEACARHGRKVQLEMGGKNPLVVLDDANLEQAVECAVDGAFFSTGQRCTASSRLVVTEGIYSRFVEELSTRVRALRVGDPLDPQTDMGPVASQAQLDQCLHYIEGARTQGASLRTGGGLKRASTEGYFLEPTLFADTSMEMDINREEVFGPVASVVRVRNYDEALAVANDTPFGLCAGICTQSLKLSSDFRKQSAVGMVMVNLPTAGVDYHVPFGGSKASSLGEREQGGHARGFFTKVKTAYIRP